MHRPFAVLLTLTILFEALALSDDALSFTLSHSWNFPETQSKSLILNDCDTPIDISVNRPLQARVSSHQSLEPLWNIDSDRETVFESHDGDSRRRVGIAAPDVSDRHTLLNLAKASWDAYYPGPMDDNWYHLDGMNWTSRNGWRPGQHGLRGHLFMTFDKRHGLVVFKGTSPLVPHPDTRVRDQLNNNLLFSCCCATVPWRLETSHPCQCDAGRQQCCSSCLTESLLDEETYYSNGVALLEYFRFKYPHTTFWMTGHSLGGAVASLVARRFDLPAVTFQTPGERLAAKRLGILPFPESSTHSHITHVYNTIDPLATGQCSGPLSICAQFGYALESTCHSGNVIQLDVSGKDGGWWKNPYLAHLIENVIIMLEDETVGIPKGVKQAGCWDCPDWTFGEFPINRPNRSWWRRILEKIFGEHNGDNS